MFTNPQKNVERFEIMPGYKVADLGSGAGFYVLSAARLVGDSGRVYAVDIQKELLSKTKTDATSKHLTNVEVIWGDVEKIGGTRLADSSIDTVIASNILFQLEDKDSFIKEVNRILKPKKGKAYIIDWADSFGGLGPENSAVVSLASSKEMFLKNGFEVYKELKDVGDHHYGISFKKI
ncbi:MAG: methyltransferase domain-containing protein [Patescibacteria group bacterium]